MNFAADRDLLVMEPGLFFEVPFVAQQRWAVSDGVVSGNELSSATGGFVAHGIGAGSVALLGEEASGRVVPHEVTERVDDQTLTVSLIRGRVSDALIEGEQGAGEDGQGMRVVFRTFEPQLSVVHGALLGLLGISEDVVAGELNENDILSVQTMVRLETLCGLHRIYSSAAAATGENAGYLAKAKHYREAFQQAWRSARVLVDRSGLGDVGGSVGAGGGVEEVRAPGWLRLVRR